MRITTSHMKLLLILTATVGLSGFQVHAQNGAGTAGQSGRSPGEQQIAASSKAGHTSFILFYEKNDRLTQTAWQTLKAETDKRDNMAVLPIRLDSTAERGLIERFDASRAPMPSIVALAPNGAVTGVFSRRIKPEQVAGAFVTPGYAQCIRAMQNQRIVLLCVQPESDAFIPQGVKQFQAEDLYRDRTEVVSIRANDPAESRFIQQLGLNKDTTAPQVVFMAPPGVLLGKYNSNVTLTTLATKLASAGKCCDDENCKYHRSANGGNNTQKR